MSNFKETLKKLNSCQEAVDWVGDRDLEAAWAECDRGDWMLWLAGLLRIDRNLLVLTACDCAEPALRYVPESESRPAEALRVARAWCNGEATSAEVQVAAVASAEASVAAAYAYAAEIAAADIDEIAAADIDAVASANAAVAAADAANAANATNVFAAANGTYNAAYTAAYAAAYAATDAAAARLASLKHSAELVRKRISVEVIRAALEPPTQEGE